MHNAFSFTYTPSTSSRGLDALTQLIIDALPEYAELRAQFAGGTAGASPQSSGPKTLTFDLPGYAQSDLSIEITHDHVLTVTAQNEKRGKVTRAIYLEEGADEAGITAKLESGVLTLTIPKLAVPKARKVVVA